MTQAGQAREPLSLHPKSAPFTAKLEVIVIPVSDVDRAKEFYGSKLGWRLEPAPGRDSHPLWISAFSRRTEN